MRIGFKSVLLVFALGVLSILHAIQDVYYALAREYTVAVANCAIVVRPM